MKKSSRPFGIMMFIGMSLTFPAVKSQDFSAFLDSNIGKISPQGWLREFLERQAAGLTGHPEALAYPYNTCLWAGDIERKNENPYAKDWWRYEQTAYYTDGLLRLGYLLDIPEFIEKGEEGIRYTITHAQPDGRLGNEKIESLWPMAVFFRAMRANYEVTGDENIIKALEKHYLSLDSVLLTNGRRHILSLEGMLYIYGVTRNPKLLQLAEDAYALGGFELDASEAASPEPIKMHGVTYAEMLKIPLLLYAYTGKPEYLKIALNAERKLERDHLLPDGLYTSAEYTSGNDIDIAHETCDITDYVWSLGHFLTVTGDAEWGDRLEKALFNAGLGAITKDFKAIQYFSSVNQLICTATSDNNEYRRGKTWMAYRPIHETECCVGNVHRMMPNFASRLWLTGSETGIGGNKGIVAALYAPSEVKFDVDGIPVTIREDTHYPFEGNIRFNFSMEKECEFPFLCRIPGWIRGGTISVNGQERELTQKEYGTFLKIERKFKDGDIVELQFDIEPHWVKAGEQGYFVERGPLVYAYPLPSEKIEDNEDHPNMNGKKSENPDFKSWNITPAGPFNYAVSRRVDETKLHVEEHRDRLLHDYPFDLDAAPVSITIPVSEIEWELEEGIRNPFIPVGDAVKTNGKKLEIELVPYGCTELRLTVFPIIR